MINELRRQEGVSSPQAEIRGSNLIVGTYKISPSTSPRRTRSRLPWESRVLRASTQQLDAIMVSGREWASLASREAGPNSAGPCRMEISMGSCDVQKRLDPNTLRLSAMLSCAPR
jgi:hypothetical protein